MLWSAEACFRFVAGKLASCGRVSSCWSCNVLVVKMKCGYRRDKIGKPIQEKAQASLSTPKSMSDMECGRLACAR